MNACRADSSRVPRIVVNIGGNAITITMAMVIMTMSSSIIVYPRRRDRHATLRFVIHAI
jgi:hypothetical protein